MYDYEDFYDSYSPFDQQIDEFKQSLLQSVKDEYVKELDRLRKENEELQEVKTNFEKVKYDYSIKKQELQREYDELKRNVRREYIGQLMKDTEVEYFGVESQRKSTKEKCNKCNNNRYIEYKTPLGKAASEKCDCDRPINEFFVTSIILKSLSFRDGKAQAWYKVKGEYDKKPRHDDWLEYYDDSIHSNKLIKDESEFKKVSYYGSTMFETKELAEKYAEYRNNAELKRVYGDK